MNKSTRSTAIAFLPAFLVFIGAATPGAKAEVTWNYSGRETTGCFIGSCPEAGLLIDSLNLSVTFNTPLAANLFEQEELSSIAAWTITDTQGYVNLSSTTTGTFTFDFFSTDSSGNIIGPTVFSVYGPGWQGPDASAAAVGTCDVECEEVGVSDSADNISVSTATSDGKWSNAPEPSSTLLMAVGAGILLLARRRKCQIVNRRRITQHRLFW
jgi:hypothetical protein